MITETTTPPSAGGGSAGGEVGVLFECLAGCKPFDPDNAKGRWPKLLNWVATRANVLGLCLLVSFVVFAVLVQSAGPAGEGLKGALLLCGRLLLPLFGLSSLLATVASDVWHLYERAKQQGLYWTKAYEHDAAHANAISGFSLATLKLVDSWFEQNTKRLERRQTRFFGGNDKLALLTLIAAAWAAWKEVGAMVQGAEPSWLLFGLAFAGGLILGGLALSRQWERMGYLRDLLAVAIKRKELAASG